MADFQRVLDVDGTFNFRDVGHYPARDGRRTRPGVFYRSGALHDLGPVARLGVRTVIDLRVPRDLERDAGSLGGLREHADVRRVAEPLVPSRIGDRTGFEHLNALYGAGVSAKRYRGYLDVGAASVRAIFARLAGPDAFPSVVHCTAGKDRTGVITALVLDVLGVAHETILADYALSNESVPHLMRMFSGEDAGDREPSEADLARFGAPREAMEGFLEALVADFGDARSYLSGIGVPEDTFALLEERLLEDGRDGRTP